MALTINTNLGSLIVEKNLEEATKVLNKSISKMTKNNKCNEELKDINSNFEKTDKMQTLLNSISVCQDNVAVGSSLLSTTNSKYNSIDSLMSDIKNLTKEAASGNCDEEKINNIKSKIEENMNEIDKISKDAEFNDVKLLDGSQDTDIKLKIAPYSSDSSNITFDKSLFKEADFESLTGTTKTNLLNMFSSENNDYTEVLKFVEKGLSNISEKQTKIQKSQNKLDVAADALDVQYANITSALSTIKDADVASESSDYIKAQILQQASASLLSVANQTPSNAINLI